MILYFNLRDLHMTKNQELSHNWLVENELECIRGIIDEGDCVTNRRGQTPFPARTSCPKIRVRVSTCGINMAANIRI